MPAAIPYAPADYYRPRNRIADLILAAGQARAAGAARSGEIWGDAIARAASGIGGAIADAPRLREEKAEREAATAFRERQMATLEQGEQREEAVSGALGGYGQEGFDINAAVSSLPPDAQLGARKIYQELESSRLQADESTAYVLAKGAHIAESLLETPLQDVGMELVSKYFRQHFPQQMERLEQTVKEDPSKLKPLLQHLQGQSERFRKELEARKPKTREIKTRQPGGGERIEIVEDVPGLVRESAPAPEQPLSRIEAEAAARARGTARGKPPGGDEEKLYPVDVFNDETGEMERTFVTETQARAMATGQAPALGKGPGTAERNRMGAARASIQAGEALLKDLSDPQFTAEVGPIIGRFNSLTAAAGAGEPQAQYLVGALKSFAALQPQIHGFRAVQMAENVEKLLSTKQTPKTLAAGLRGILTASYIVAKRKPTEEARDPVSEILSMLEAAGRR